MVTKSKISRALAHSSVYGLLLLTMANNCQPSPPQPQVDHFVFGYVTGATSTPGSGSIVMRWAKTGPSLDWEAGNFPTGVHPSSGVGVMTDVYGVMHIALTDMLTSEIQMVWGLGPAIWDNSGQSPAAAPPESSPVGIVLDYPRFAVAYRRSGGTLAVSIYDQSTRSFVADVAPPGTLNTNVTGRPDMTRMGNTVVLTWRRWNGTVHDLITSKGTVTGGNVSFSTPHVVPTPSGSGLIAGVQSDPAVTRTDTKFFLAAVREQTGGGGGGLHGWRTHVFESADGATWTSNAIISSLTIDNVSLIGLAGVRGGKVIAVALNNTGSGAQASGAVFDGTSWQGMPTSELNDMVTSTPSFRHFALVGVIK